LPAPAQAGVRVIQRGGCEVALDHPHEAGGDGAGSAVMELRCAGGMHVMARYEFIAVYIMANKRNGTLYIGVTSDLPLRAYQHRIGQGSEFTTKYGCKRLVWAERHETMDSAIRREKRLKKYPRKWKLNLIEALNPNWDDLYEQINML